MPYSTQADVQHAAGGPDRLRECSDWENTGAIDAAVVAAAIQEADSWMNTYIHKRFHVDLPAPVPDVIVKCSAKEAVFRMKDSRGMTADDDTARHEERRLWLEALAAGKVSIGVSPMPAKSPEHMVDKAVPRADTKAVSRQKLEGFS